jgi:hypothetical protein
MANFTAIEPDNREDVNYVIAYHALPCVVGHVVLSDVTFLRQYAWGYAIMLGGKFHVHLPSKRGVRAGNVTVFSVGVYDTYYEAMSARQRQSN